ncbi:MAG: YncE family protein [Actinomycetota bacterium]|nr:YncE family protein [Actinomycetota bacterium]
MPLRSPVLVALLLTLAAVSAAVKPLNAARLRSSRGVYSATAAGHLAPAAKRAPARVYVPNSESNTVDVIDARSMRIVRHFPVGDLPQHVTPAHDLRTLYVDDDAGNMLTPIDPISGRPGRPIPVDDPYNLYFTPDGRTAIVVAERLHRLDFRDPHTFRLQSSLHVPCTGVNHLDFSGEGRYAIASCEFSGQLLKVAVRRRRLIGVLRLRRQYSVPQDVRVARDGKTFYIADMAAGGVWRVDGRRFRVSGFVRTGSGAHGLVVSRDARTLYVANRNAGTVSLLAFKTGRIVTTWRIPGGSPDMGGVSADGRTLWLSGRYNSEVYAINTRTGHLRARIRVGASPHGLCVWPQPGRYSLGHTGNMR